MSKVFDLMLDVKGPNSTRPHNRLGDAERKSISSGERVLKGEVLSPIFEPANAWVRGIDTLRRHWRVSALFAALLTFAVATITLLTKPIYEPIAALQINPPGTETFSLQSGGGDSNSVEYITTETKKLQSNILALELVRTLHLERSREFAGGRAITTANPSPAELRDAENAAVRTVQRRITIKRDMSRIVYVTVGARDPHLASKLTNTLVNSFIESEERTRHEAVLRSSQWLAKQLDDIRQRMYESNKTVADFERSSGIVPLGDSQQGGNTVSEQMTELNRQLLQARADRIQLQSYLGRVGDHRTFALPQISSNPVVQALTQKLAETRADLTNALAVYGPNHPNIRRLQNQVDELASQLESQKAAILSEMTTSYQASQVREEMVQGQVKDTEKKLALFSQYMALKKEAEANTQLYNSLSAKIRESGIAAESKSNPIWVVDPAPVLDRPTRPHKLTQMSLGTLFAIFGGILLAFVVEAFNTTVHTTADVQHSLGMVPVSIMPVIVDSDETGANRNALLRIGRRPANRSPLFVLDRPRSPETEALRAFYTSVRLRVSDAARAFLVASPMQGEGKTTMAVNLALTLAERGRTCIVDADLRKEGVASAFGLTPKQGLSNVLANATPLNEALVQTSVANVTVLPAGKCAGDVARLVCSDAMANVIHSLRSEFDFVVVDSPPILPFADCLALSTLVDGVVLVGRSGQTKGDSLVRAIELLQEVGSAPVIQVVLNAVQLNATDYSYYYKYHDRSANQVN